MAPFRSAWALGLALSATSAWSQGTGRLHVLVEDAETHKPIPGAVILISDPTKAHADLRLTALADGGATTDPLTAHDWLLSVTAADYNPAQRTVTVVAERITNVDINLRKPREIVITIRAARTGPKPSETTQAVVRNQSFIQQFAKPGNNQSLNSVLQTTAGFVADSNGQLHPEGEHSSTSYFVNNFQLPSGFQGHLGSYLAPSTVQSLEVLTGGYAPEYGRDTAAVIDAQIRTGTPKPFAEYSLTGGGFDTWEGGLVLGGQFGHGYGTQNAEGAKTRSFSYLINLDYRYTNNLEEPPQPDVQTAHNRGSSMVSFGNLDWRLGAKDRLNLIVADNPARSEVANRTGLPNFYATVGQGFGFGGLQPASSGLPNQQQLGQDDYEKDSNAFGILTYRHSFNPHTDSRLAFGMVYNGLDIGNNNPAINLAALPSDNSIEFNPTAIRNARDYQSEGNLTSTLGHHTFKTGFTVDRQTGLEYYQLTPASIAALNDLLSGDPSGATPPDPTNPLYLLAPINGVSSYVTVHRSGYYNAAYAQDTWKLTKALSANYGLRYEVFTSDQSTSQNGGAPVYGHVGLQELEPRLNLSYQLPANTVFRTSYNRLMIVPPSAQGAGIGAVTIPEKINQYEASLERQISPGQSAKVRYYLKQIRDQLDTGLLAPGTQVGIYVTDNIPKDYVRGFEISYNFFPPTPHGFDGYFSYANATAKPQGIGAPYNDHDQLNTISSGVDYKFQHGEEAGLTVNYGSGVFSSVVFGNTRTPHTDVSLRLSSAPNLFGLLGGRLTIEAQNLFDARNVLNFQSAFSGTRFQQGRRLLLTWSGKI
jgi:outer membrane receptor protein involved in Fe transport